MLILHTGDIRGYDLFSQRCGCECCSNGIFWKSYWLNDLLQWNVLEIIGSGDSVLLI